jgi:hypothetical protein
LTKIKQIYCKDVLFSDYSRWHRNQTHSAIAMIDVDKVSCCHACNEPLFLAETVKHNGQELIKGHSMIRKLAIKASLPAFIIWYKIVGGQMPLYVYVKKIAPDYKGGYESPPERKTFDEWLHYLEFKQVEHFPKCKKQWLFIKKVKEDPIASKKEIYAPVLR